MKRVLIVGDAVVTTGFSKAVHAYADGLKTAGYDVHILAMHHTGDKHDYPHTIYTCWPGGDQFGVGRIRNIVEQVKPDVIVIVQDPWNVRPYLAKLKDFQDIPVVGVIAVDGKNCQGDKLGPVASPSELIHPGLAHAIFWTQFGADEARIGGWRGKSTVVPLGVDLDVYHPQDRAAIRREILQPIIEQRGWPSDAYIVGSVGRNQTRKRLDLTVQYFAEWTQLKNIRNAVLWFHVAPTGDDDYDLNALAKYFGVSDRILISDINPRYGFSEEVMSQVYNAFDVLLLTGMGEGWSLPTIEAMACGTPCIVPDWSALGEWAKPAAWLCECPVTDVAPKIMTIGGRVARKEVVDALSRLYHEPHSRKTMADAGLALVSQPEYRWDAIGARVAEVVGKVLNVGAETPDTAAVPVAI